MTGKYLVAYRKGAGQHATRLSKVASADTAFDMERLFYDHLSKRKALPADFAREGKTTPKKGGSVPRTLLKVPRLQHPALNAMRLLMNADQILSADPVKYMIPGWFMDHECNTALGTGMPGCGYNLNEMRVGIHHIVNPIGLRCLGGQAIGGPVLPDPASWTGLGATFSIWIKRLNCPNSNPWQGFASLPAAEKAAVLAKGGPWLVKGLRRWERKTDPFAAEFAGTGGVTNPHLDPMSLAVGQAQPLAVAIPWGLIPYRVVDPMAAPSERTDFGPEAVPRTLTEPKQLEVHPNRRPTRGERERKVMVPAIILKIVGEVTEGLDFIKAMYPCLPKAIRAANERAFYRGLRGDRRRKDGRVTGQRGKRTKIIGQRRKYTPADKAALLYKNWGDLDIKCAMFNFMWDQIEDTAYAKISQGSKLPGQRRAHELSRQGDAELPQGQLPTSELKKWLQFQLGISTNG